MNIQLHKVAAKQIARQKYFDLYHAMTYPLFPKAKLPSFPVSANSRRHPAGVAVIASKAGQGGNYFSFVGLSLHLDAVWERHFRLSFLMHRLSFALSFYYPGGFSAYRSGGLPLSQVSRARGMGAL